MTAHSLLCTSEDTDNRAIKCYVVHMRNSQQLYRNTYNQCLLPQNTQDNRSEVSMLRSVLPVLVVLGSIFVFRHVNREEEFIPLAKKVHAAYDYVIGELCLYKMAVVTLLRTADETAVA